MQLAFLQADGPQPRPTAASPSGESHAFLQEFSEWRSVRAVGSRADSSVHPLPMPLILNQSRGLIQSRHNPVTVMQFDFCTVQKNRLISEAAV